MDATNYVIQEKIISQATSYVATVVGIGIERAVDAVGISYRWWILATAASTLDSTLTAGTGTIDTAATMGTSNRRAIDAVGNVTDVVGTSSIRRIR
jgi:hypothetical protein